MSQTNQTTINRPQRWPTNLLFLAMVALTGVIWLASGGLQGADADGIQIRRPKGVPGLNQLDTAVTTGAISGRVTAESDAALADLQYGFISGKVTATDGLTPLGWITTCPYFDYGSGWQRLGGLCVYTDSSGEYTIHLPVGTYKVSFDDYLDDYLSEFYNDAPDIASATDVLVTANNTTADINAALADYPPPDNDDFDNAVEILTFPYDDGRDVWQATTAVDDPTPPCFPEYYGQSVWYTLTPQQNGRLSVVATGYGAGLVVWQGTRGSLTDVACADYWEYEEEGGTYVQSEIDDLPLTAGTTYYIEVLGDGDEDEWPVYYLNLHVDFSAENAETGRILGTVEAGADGTKLKNIRVAVYKQVNGGWQWASEVLTAADGSFACNGLLPGIYHVYFSDKSGTYLDEFHLNALDHDTALDIPVTAGSTYIINARLAKAGHITGKVTREANGEPLENIDVSAYEEINGKWEKIKTVMTSADGTYDLGGLRTRTYRVRFFPYANIEFPREWYDNAPQVGQATNISVKAGEVTAGINAALAEYGITGRVTKESDGSPLADISVLAYEGDGGGSWNLKVTEKTGVNGQYSLALPPGTYRLEFKDENNFFFHEFYDDVQTNINDATSIVVAEAQTISGINAALDGTGRISGRVTAETDSKPLSGIDVRLYNDISTLPLKSGSTNANGDYIFTGLPEGSYRIRFKDTQNNVYQEEYFDNKPDLTNATVIQVSAGNTTTGIDAELRPYPALENDDFATALEISTFPFSDSKDVRGATTAEDDPIIPCGYAETPQGYASVWYAMTPGKTGLLTADTFGSSYDTVLVVWQGTRGSLSAVACNDDDPDPQRQPFSKLSDIPLAAGKTYYVEIVGKDNADDENPIEELKLSVDFVPEYKLWLSAIFG